MNLLHRLQGGIETERLLLRHWKRGDFEAYLAVVSNPEVMTPAGCRAARDLEEAASMFRRDRRNEMCYAILLKEGGQVVGRIKYQNDLRRFHVNSLSLGYELRQDCWGRGYMTEALRAMVANAFERRKVDVVAVSHFAGNTRSQRVIEKCGFRLEGTVPWALRRFDGEICDDVCYSILREDYFAAQDAAFR
ncbi:GNAT family N-acetyltransferase [Oscillospiraceae bacterium 42-9]|jgi:ribosomal-protein-alanine N-acetyltransferase|uniref:GNAT family N-acetyltransferase n=1 Tax=Acutalibacter sp. TaxID=1918636 RepID=UPI002172EA04|nr:GNAT family N-acetyltransferase [Acutalibacter sp.]